jgi:hypothetical protein
MPIRNHNLRRKYMARVTPEQRAQIQSLVTDVLEDVQHAGIVEAYTREGLSQERLMWDCINAHPEGKYVVNALYTWGCTDLHIARAAIKVTPDPQSYRNLKALSED